MMKRLLVFLLPTIILFASSQAGHADQFSDLRHDPNLYWVPAPTPPPPGYVQGAPPPYYNGPPPVYYYGPPPPPPPPIPRFFIGFHFH